MTIDIQDVFSVFAGKNSSIHYDWNSISIKFADLYRFSICGNSSEKKKKNQINNRHLEHDVSREQLPASAFLHKGLKIPASIRCAVSFTYRNILSQFLWCDKYAQFTSSEGIINITWNFRLASFEEEAIKTKQQIWCDMKIDIEHPSHDSRWQAIHPRHSLNEARSKLISCFVPRQMTVAESKNKFETRIACRRWRQTEVFANWLHESFVCAQSFYNWIHHNWNLDS